MAKGKAMQSDASLRKCVGIFPARLFFSFAMTSFTSAGETFLKLNSFVGLCSFVIKLSNSGTVSGFCFRDFLLIYFVVKFVVFDLLPSAIFSCRLWHGSRVVILKIEKSQ